VDPATALIFSIIVARVIIAAWEASGDHAAWEARTAREAVAREMRRRHRRLVNAMDTGRASGPWSGWWWGYQGVVTARYGARLARWGGVMAARTVRAGWRGGRLAWHLTRQQRRPRWAGRVPVGVCRGCGWVVAVSALDPATRTCPACRAGQPRTAPAVAQPSPPSRPAEPGPEPEPEIVDAEIVEDPSPVPAAAAAPAIGGGDTELPALETGGTQMDSTPAGGEAHTHGAWNQSSSAIQDILAALASGLDNMLGSLTAQNAGRDQVTGVTAWADQVTSCITHGQAHIADTNARQDPVVDAVSVAGGPEQTADMNYYAEV
jgi:hypothetical protein